MRSAQLIVTVLVSGVAGLQAPVTRVGHRQRAAAVASIKEPETEVAPPPEASSNMTVAVEISQIDEYLINWGLKEDPRIPEECRVSPIERIKNSGRAGVAAYALTEGAFWLTSLPLAVAAVAYTTGSLPDVSTLEGKEAVAGYVLAFTTFARTVVPLRIALALALAPWCDRNIIQKFFPPESISEECDVIE